MASNQAIQYVVDKDSRPLAVQVNIEIWETILDKLKDLKDLDFINKNIHRLREGSARRRALFWADVKHERDGD
ncbi:MAG: hypothetical protein GYA34_16245 [Chloroflexi bacterium]|nr:hypothetical protein [Chloroflexota bacterium]